MYLKLRSLALIDLRAQSLTWDTLCAEVLRISLAAAYLQSIQWLARDTVSHLEISAEIAEISITFYFACAIRPVGQPSQNIWRILLKFLLRTVAKVPSQKKLCPEAAS